MNLLITIAAIIPTWYWAQKNPIYALSALLFLIPTFLIRWSLEIISFNTFDVLVAGAFLIWAYNNCASLSEALTRHRYIFFLLVLFVLSAGISALTSENTQTSLGILKSYFIIPMLFVIILFGSIKKRKDITTLLCTLAALSFIVSLIGIMQRFFPEGFSGWFAIPNASWRGPENIRITSILQYPNAVALFLAPLIPLFISLFYLSQKNVYKFFILLATLSSALAVFLTKSKGALAALIISAVFFVYYSFPRKKILVITVFALLFIFFVPSLNTFISTAGLGSYSAQLRFTQWQEAWELLKENPLTGAGLANYQNAIQPYHTKEYIEVFLYPHNIVLNFWTELGLYGLVVFSIMLLHSLKKSMMLFSGGTANLRKKIVLPGIAAMLIILIHGLVDVPYFKNDLAVIFFLVWSWPFLIEKIYKDGGLAEW